MYGAVDLGARQQAAQRRQQTAASDTDDAGDATGPGGAVVDVTEETFDTEVVQRSLSVPVIVDLWADWCEPCKQLSPVLEKLAAEANGQWVLAKIDVDANQRLARALQAQSIPMVIAVAGGQPVDGFLGALPEAQVRQWLSQVLAASDQLGAGAARGTAAPEGASASTEAADRPGAGATAGPGAPGGAPPDGPGRQGGGGNPLYAAAQQAMEQGDTETAADAFRKVLASTPADPVAKVGLARVELLQRVNGYDEADVRRTAAQHPVDVTAQCRVADIDLAGGRIDEAFDRLLGLVRRTAGEERERARVHLVGLFAIFPPRDPRVADARAELSRLLF